MIALALCAVLHDVGCSAAPAELTKMSSAPIRPVRPTAATDPSNRLRAGSSWFSSELVPTTLESTGGFGALRRMGDVGIADVSRAREPAGDTPGLHLPARSWGPSAPVGGRMPAAHLDLWSTSTGRVALAVHRGVSLQARFVFGAK